MLPAAARSSGVPWKTRRPSARAPRRCRRPRRPRPGGWRRPRRCRGPGRAAVRGTACRCAGSRPAVGSSSSSIAGSLTMACAMPARRTMPPDSVFIRSSARSARPDPFDRPAAPRRGVRLRHLLQPGHVLDELAHGEPRVEAEVLRQVAEPATQGPRGRRPARAAPSSSSRPRRGAARWPAPGSAWSCPRRWGRAGRARRCPGRGRARRPRSAGRRVPAGRWPGPPRRRSRRGLGRARVRVMRYPLRGSTMVSQR